MRSIAVSLIALVASGTVALADNHMVQSFTMTDHSELSAAVSAFQEGVSELESAAQGGSAAAQYYLGVMKIDGIMVQDDLGEGLTLLRQSAEAGFGPALFTLGNYLYYGANMVPDHENGRKMVEAAADKGFEPASMALSSMPPPN